MKQNNLWKLLSKSGQEVTKHLSIHEILDLHFINSHKKLTPNDKKKLLTIAEDFIAYNRTDEIDRIKSPTDVSDLMMPELRGKSQEELHMLCLNTKNQVIHREMVFKGSLNASIVHPREIFRITLRYATVNIIIVHNHPSGDPTPSQEDIEATNRLINCRTLFGIEVLDHVVIGNGDYVSIREKGRWKCL
nr:DNA repair protein RadC [Macrococcus bovicus]